MNAATTGLPPPYSSEPQSPLRGAARHRAGVMGSPTSRSKQIDLSLESGERLASPPMSPVRIDSGRPAIIQPVSAQIETLSTSSRSPSSEYPAPVPNFSRVRSPEGFRPTTSTSAASLSPPPPGRLPPAPPPHRQPLGQAPVDYLQGFSRSMASQKVMSPQIIATDVNGAQNPLANAGEPPNDAAEEPEPVPQLQYFHHRDSSDASGSYGKSNPASTPGSQPDLLNRPMSAMMLDERNRSASPGGLSVPRSRGTPGARPKSYLEQLNDPYIQAAPAATGLTNDTLRPAVGLNASLLSTRQTFEMYKANIKKTPDLKVQYDFALFMIQAAAEARQGTPGGQPISSDSPLADPSGLVKEARKILETLAGKSYPFAQYYLADGLANGTFTKNGEPDDAAAFPLFQAASKHGHAEAGYRAGLCYEFGWGCSRSGAKSEQFFRASASKGHPGSMTRLSRACLTGDLGNLISEKEGVRWLRLAAEAADEQFNEGPYLLARLHENGFGSDVFKDPAYAATLYTRSAELGHADAAFHMGKAYEDGELECPNDAALSVHFYTLAANQGHPDAMMGLVAWYLVGAPGFLDADEAEAFEWVKESAATGLPKAAYALGYFYESGIGCRRDPLEANKWYVRAAEMGEERAKQRLHRLRDAASGRLTALPAANDEKEGKKSRSKSRNREDGDGDKKKKFGIF